MKAIFPTDELVSATTESSNQREVSKGGRAKWEPYLFFLQNIRELKETIGKDRV